MALRRLRLTREHGFTMVEMIVVLVVITFVPETTLWLPRMFGYKG